MAQSYRIQAELFGSVDATKSGRNQHKVNPDPSFGSNKSAPVHRWVPWIAGFSADFVRSTIDENLRKKGTVLDPFAGVGTSLLEAIVSGHNAVGFEINPYAALACRTKCAAVSFSPGAVTTAIEEFGDFCRKQLSNGYRPTTVPPPSFRSRVAFYNPAILRKVLVALDYISLKVPSQLSDLFRLAFGSVMVDFSNYSYEPSLSSRIAAGRKEPQDAPVIEALEAKLRSMVDDIKWIKASPESHFGSWIVHGTSFFDSRKLIEGSSIDLMVTSPPYLNNYHYNRNTRPHLYWLGLINSGEDLRTLERLNFGKYWQTVRGESEIHLDFPNVPAEVADCVARIRKLGTDRGVYGGNGWANYAASYFNDCHRFAKNTMRVLKRRAKAAVVIGNNVVQGVSIPTDVYLGQICESAGLQLLDIRVPRQTRVGNSIIRSSVRVNAAEQKQSLYESVVLLRKR